MANNTYTRRINLYINDKEVKHDIQSIQKEFHKANNKLKRMEIGSKEYIAQIQKVKGLKGIMAEHNQQLKEVQKTGFSFSKVTDGFNKYFGVITAGAASMAGLIMAGRKAIDEFNKFDDQVADVMKTTGMTKDEVLELDKRLQKINTRTAQEELLGLGRVAGKLGITGVEDVEGFVRAADKINVALSEDLGGDAEQAINEIGKLTDIFKLKDEFGIEQSMLKVGSAINSLGAASTANEGYLVEFTKRMAGVAPAANVSIDQVLGLGATLDQFGQTSEVSSSTIAAVLTDMFKSPGEYAAIAGMKIEDFNDLLAKDSNEAFIKFLEGLNGNNDGLGVMANKLEGLGLAGKRSVSVLGVLSNNTQTLREQQALSAAEFEKGTSLQDEFNIKNETAQAKLDKARKAMGLYRRELGEKLQPVMAGIVSKGTLMMKALSGMFDLFTKYKAQIIIVAGAIAAYAAAEKIKSKWDQITLAYTKAKTIATKAYGIGLSLATGKIKLTTIATKALNKAWISSPIGLVVAGLTVLAGITVGLVKLLNKQTAAQRALNEVQKEAEKAIKSEKTEIEKLLKYARDERLSREEREKAIKRLNEISPEYLGNLSLETINTDEATKSINDYIKAMEEKALVQAIDDKISALMEENAEKEIDGTKGKIKWYQALGNAVLTSGNVVLAAGLNARTEQNNREKYEKKYNETLDALMTKRAEILSKGQSADGSTELTDAEKAELAAAEEEKARKEAADKAAAQRVENAKKALEQLEESHDKELVELKRQMIEKNETKEWFDEQSLQLERDYLTKKLSLQKVSGDKTLKTEEQILDNQLKLREKYQKNIEGLEKAINDIKEDFSLEDEGVFDEEGAEKAQEQLKRYEELKQKFKSEEETQAEQFNSELAELQEAMNSGLLTHEEFEKKKLEITNQYSSKRLDAENKYLKGAGAVVDTFASVFEAAKQRELAAAGDNAEQREAIEKKYAKKQQKIAIGQAFINGAKAQLKILAEVPKADFGIMTAILMAAAAAATAAEIATIKNQQFYAGGYTQPGGKYEPAGIVHKGEFVGSQEAVKNPSVRSLFDVVDMAQRNGTIRQLNLPRFNTTAIAGAVNRGFASGGYTSTPTTAVMPTTGNDNAETSENAALMGAMIGLLQKLDRDGVRADVNALEIRDKIDKFNKAQNDNTL